jgi:predicted transcriptional regulator
MYKGFRKTFKTILDENNLDVVHFAKVDIEGSELISITQEQFQKLKIESVVFL